MAGEADIAAAAGHSLLLTEVGQQHTRAAGLLGLDVAAHAGDTVGHTAAAILIGLGGDLQEARLLTPHEEGDARHLPLGDIVQHSDAP